MNLESNTIIVTIRPAPASSIGIALASEQAVFPSFIIASTAEDVQMVPTLTELEEEFSKLVINAYKQALTKERVQIDTISNSW